MNTTLQDQPQVLCDNRTAAGHAYVELLPDGKVKAGYYKDTARLYGSADEAHAHFRQAYSFSNSHSAWNIAYALEEYLSQRDDGR